MKNMKALDRLIEILCAERGERVPELTDSEKPRYFRALCNIRPPMPTSEEFLTLQDEYLTDFNARRGIFDAAEFSYDGGIALWQGDITQLKCDAIVNACNSRLLGCFQPLHNCIDNCIHSFAGVQVRRDCAELMQGGEEPNGQVKVTGAYNLPSKFIFHTVGPIVYGRVTESNERDLSSCYLSCLDEAKARGLGSIAFCCLSTGVFGYPKKDACAVAVRTVKEWLKASGYKLKVIFNVFTDEDRGIYEKELAKGDPKIVRCEAGDLNALVDFYDEVTGYLVRTVNYPKWTPGVYPGRESIGRDIAERTQYMCLKDGAVVGAFVLNADPRGAYEKGNWRELQSGEYAVIHTLAVAPAAHGQGIGRKMVEFCIEKAKRDGYKAIRVDVVPTNTPARGLYERTGFVFAGEHDLLRGIAEIPRFVLYGRDF